jgi:hypothetical protein
MMLCLNCYLQRPNHNKSFTCPHCGAYLKYVEATAKPTIIKFHKAGLHISYAVAEVYDYANGAIHAINICIGIAHPYPVTVFRRLPDGYEYIFPEEYTPEYLSRLPIEHLISPVRTYGILRYEAEYLDNNEAKPMLRQKLKELDIWIDDAVAEGWLAICNLGGWLD